MNEAEALKFLAFIKFSERLKTELRHSWLSNGRQESVAEHCFQAALAAVALAPQLEHPVDLLKTLKMVLIHDLGEAEAGDVPFFSQIRSREEKFVLERNAIESLSALLPPALAGEILELWLEFETGQSYEAKFVRALDALEVQIQHNFSDLSTWIPVEYDLVYTKMDRHCAHDETLKQVCSAVKGQAEAKLAHGGIDIAAVKERVFNGGPQKQ